MARPKPLPRWPVRGLVLAAGLATAYAAALSFAAGPRGTSDHVPPWFPSGPPARDFLATLPGDVQVDNFGNAWVTRGSGSPHVLVLAHRDAPGWVVSQITPDGFLRVQRLGTGASPLLDQFLVGKRLVVYTRRGPLPAVTVAPSTHFRRGANVPVPEATTDDLWIDVGAESGSEAEAMGISLLDPIVPLDHAAGIAAAGIEVHERVLRGYAAGVRSACRMLATLAASHVPAHGTLTCAWVAGGSEGGRGSRRLLARLGAPDSVIVVEPVAFAGPDSVAQVWIDHPWVAPADSAHAASLRWASDWATNLPRVEPRMPLPAVPDARVWTAAGVPTLVVELIVAHAGTPGEIATEDDPTSTLQVVVERALGASSFQPPTTDTRGPAPLSAPWGEAAATAASGPSLHGGAWRTIDPLLAAYGVSERESHVAEAVRALLPPEAARAAVVDERGNVELRLGAGPPGRLFVAHMDEIGYRVTGFSSVGQGRVERKGGFYDWLYEGEIVRTAPERGAPGLAVVPPRGGYRVGPRPALARPLDDEPHPPVAAASRFDVSDVRIDSSPGMLFGGADVTVLHEIARLGAHRFAARAIDDRFGCAALVMAARELWGERNHLPNTVWLVWSVEEETGLKGATWLADSLAHHNALPVRVHAVDTFVASDSPLESPRIGGARLGQGAVIRAVDTSHEAPLLAVDATLRLAEREGIPLQYGVTAGGNDGVPFAERGSINVPLGWPLRSSHTAVEVADLRDLESLARLVQALAEQPARDDPKLP